MSTDHHASLIDQHRAFTTTARSLVKRARAEPDPPTAFHLFRSQSFETVMLEAMGATWQAGAAAVRGLDPAWREVRDKLRVCVRTLEQDYHAWFEAGGGYDEEHILPAPALDHTPRFFTWTNPVTHRVCPQALQIGQVILLSSRWVAHRVPLTRWEKHVEWFEATHGLLLETFTLSAMQPEEKAVQDARAQRYAEALSTLCHWDVFPTCSHAVQRSIRKRFLALRETFQQPS